MMMKSRSAAAKTMRPMSSHRRALYLTAAAALGSTTPGSTSHAFSPPAFLPRFTSGGVPLSLQQTRLYSSKNNDNEGGFFGALTKAAKSVLPKSWTQSDDEYKIQLQKKEVLNEINGGLDQMLKGAPLPIRMVGKIIAPLMSSVLSTVASELGEQQQRMKDLLDDAQTYLVADPDASQALGESIRVQQPFSQSSSSTNINGKSTSTIQAVFYVTGSKAQGTAQLTANLGGISRLVLEVGGRQMEVSLTKGKMANFQENSSMFGTKGKNRINQNNIIDVEFVEKREKSP